MNANPFTLGHRYLVEQALKQCDWLHIFVVQEDASFFSYLDRWKLIEQGILGMDRVTLHRDRHISFLELLSPVISSRIKAW